MREQENSNKESDFEDNEDLDECMKEVKKECEDKPDEKVGD